MKAAHSHAIGLRPTTCIGCNGSRGHLLPDAVRNVLDLGVRYLKSSQRPTGLGRIMADIRVESRPFVRWPCSMPVKVRRTDVKKALDYLRNLRPKTTYVVSLQTMVLCRATPAADQDVIGQTSSGGRNQIKSGPADHKGGGHTLKSGQRRRFEQSIRLWPFTRPPARPKAARSGSPSTAHLGTRPHLLDQQPARGRRLLGLLQAQ